MKNMLNLNGELLTINEVNENLCEGGKVEKGVIGTQQGAYSYYDSTEVESKEDNEENGELLEYVKHDNIKTLYTEFVEDLEDEWQEIISCQVDENDTCLRATTLCGNASTVYVYNYSRNEDNKDVEKIMVIASKCMFEGLFKVA